MPISLWPISSGRTFGSSRSVFAPPATTSSARRLHKVADDKIFGNAFSERGSLAVGSLVFNTRLLPADGGGYRLDGEKYYRTGTRAARRRTRCAARRGSPAQSRQGEGASR